MTYKKSLRSEEPEGFLRSERLLGSAIASMNYSATSARKASASAARRASSSSDRVSLPVPPSLGSQSHSDLLVGGQQFGLAKAQHLIELGECAGADGLTGGSGQGDLLADHHGSGLGRERLQRAGQPVEQVLEHARVAVVVFGGEDPHAVGLNHGLAGGGYGCRWVCIGCW